MKKRIIFRLGITASLLSLFLLCSCNSETKNPNATSEPTTSISEESTHTDPNTSEESSETTFKLKIQIKNLCGMDFGMFSMIDPATGEQLNLNSVANKELLTLNADWPKDASIMQWALYDMNGNLVAEAKTDISKASSEVTITFNGDGKIESIEETMN